MLTDDSSERALSPSPAAAPGPMRVISAATLSAPRLPRWVLPVLLTAAGIHLAASARSLELPVGLALAPVAAGMISTAVMASWLERRIFLRSRSARPRRRLLLRLTQPFVALGLTVLATALAGSWFAPSIAGFLAPVLAFGGLWHAGAAMGTVSLGVVDSVVRRLVGSFRARLVWVTFVLVLGGYVLATVVGLGAVELYTAALAEPDSVSRLVLHMDSLPQAALTLDTLARYPQQLWGSLFGLVGILALPAVISACGKLADTALEGVRPLSAAFEQVGRGARDVRVQVGGSVEFAQLGDSFNGMVEALALAERMERAFGSYVSGHLLERIRAQHGEAVLPPTSRDASVFFADIRGFTSFSERLSPEALVSVLNRYFAHVVELVEAHQGYLNKFIGDAVVVVFNGPIDQPDHAERAVRCALALQSEVARLNREGAFPEVGALEVGVGVASGPMVCGNIGSQRQMEYTVIGDTVNLASRLTDQATAGAVWASEGTVRGLGSEVSVEPLPALLVKGKEAPVRAYRVLALDRATPSALAG